MARPERHIESARTRILACKQNPSMSALRPHSLRASVRRVSQPQPYAYSRSPLISNILVLIASLAVACGDDEAAKNGPPQIPALPVYTVIVESKSLPRTVTSVGSLESAEMTTVAGEIAGTVVEISTQEGERVEVGHVVLRIDDTEARANLSVRRAQLQNARDLLDRMEKLHRDGVASVRQLNNASSQFDVAAGAHRAAKTRLSKHILRAPYSGTLGLSRVDLGDYIDRGDPIVEISDTSALELRFALPQRFIADLEVGQSVLGLVGRCGPRFKGQVIAIDPRVDPRTRMVGVRAAVPNDLAMLHPGMAVRLRVVIGEHADAIVLPQEAVIRRGTKHLVQIVDAENRAHPREIRIGDYYLDGAHVLEGLVPGDQIVVAGHQKLRQPGMGVIPSPDIRVGESNPVTEVGRYGPLGCDES